jgi:hypothetical protein
MGRRQLPPTVGRMAMTLPERTVDAWVAIYLANEFPGVRLWAPTQNSLPDRDLGLRANGKLLVLEHKGTYEEWGRHRVQIHLAQLRTYCFSALRRATYYVLPNPCFGPRRYRPSELVPEEAASRVSPPGPRFEHWTHAMLADDVWRFLDGHASGPAVGALPPPPADLPYLTRSFGCDELASPPSGAPPVLTLKQLVMTLHECRAGLPAGAA